MEVHLRFTLILLVAIGVGSYAPTMAAQKDSAAKLNDLLSLSIPMLAECG